MLRYTKAAPTSARAVFIRKAGKYKQSQAAKDALKKLNDYLNANTAEPMYFLHAMWTNQQNAVTYKELRDAIMLGHMDESTLQVWQQDYANFVAVHLEPIWQQAAQAGADAIQAAATGGWVFDPMGDGMTAWVKNHGAEWITNASAESRSAIQALIGASTTGQYTVDELSRAIRPLIGLTAPQATANLKYYTAVRDNLLANHPGMKKDTAEKRAKEAAMKYAARQHRYRAFTIATTENAFAYNQGYLEYVKQAQAAGYMGDGYIEIATAEDDDVCPMCNAQKGKHFAVDEPFQGKALFAGQTMIPPFHPRCRCAHHFIETVPPVFQPTAATQQPQAGPQPWPGTSTPPAAQGAPGTSQAAIPAKIQPTPGMTFNKPLHIGNTGEMESWVDASGQEWYFKPAQTKNGSTAEPFRAYVQEAGYRVQGIVDPDSAVDVGVGNLGGKFGAFQKKIDIDPHGIDLEAWQYGPATDLGADITGQIQREHVTDWLLGNFDAHGENFVVDASGRIVGLDKEQSFRYIKDAASGKMSYTYHPNGPKYGETEPLYNTMYRRFAKGEIDLDLQDTLTYIKRVESIPDAEYREIFRDYAESLYGKGQQAEDLLDAIVDRKSSLRETYRTFYGELLTERTGKTVKFVWADEAPAVMQQPLAAVQQTAASIQGMSIADLKAIAKNKGIAYYNNMNKSQLVTAITDPTQAAAMSNQVKTRLAANAAARKAAPTVPPAKMPKGVEAADDVFRDLSRIPVSKNGVPVASDKGTVEGLGLTARRMNIGGTEYYEVSGKLTEDAWTKTVSKIKKRSTAGILEFEESDPDLALFSKSTIDLNGVAAQSRKYIDGDNTFEIYTATPGSREYHSWQGFFRARVPVTASGTFDASEMSRVLKDVGLDDLLATPTAEAERTFIKSRLIWQNAPDRVRELNGLTGQALEDKLDDILRDVGIGDGRINGVELRKICEGYSTYYDPEMAATMKKAGADYVWSGVTRSDSVVGIVKSGGLSSTNRRCVAGMRLGGASPESDMQTGGADSVFTRIGVKTAKSERYSSCFSGGPYRIIIDQKELGRTDWYAYTFDNFGTTRPSEMAARLKPEDFVKGMKRNYQYGNEIMFRRGIPLSSFTGIKCETQAARTELIRKFKLQRITEINGVPLEKFIRVGATI